MEPRGLMPYSQGLSNYHNPEPTQSLVLIPISLRSILILPSHVCLFLPKGLFPAGVPVTTVIIEYCETINLPHFCVIKGILYLF